MKFNRQQFLEDLKMLATMNIRWRHQGCSVETGMDCIGVFRYAVEKQGIALPAELLYEFSHYMRPPNGRRFLRVLRRWLVEVSPAELSPADLCVVFNRRNPQHMIVKLDEKNIGEAYEGGGTSRFLIRPMPHEYRIAACFRIPDEF